MPSSLIDEGTLAFGVVSIPFRLYSPRPTQLAPSRHGDLEVEDVIPALAVDSLCPARVYFLGPARGADRAYRVIANALHVQSVVAVARFASRDLTIIRAFRGGLVRQDYFFVNEVRPSERELADRLHRLAS